MKTEYVNCLFALCLLVFSQPIIDCHAQRQSMTETPGVVRFENIETVVETWSPERQLYVQGDIGASAQQLTELSKWLKQNGPHWTVVLMHDGDGQTYSFGTERHSNRRAVQYALGPGLSNRTDFGKLTHPKTGQADGAVLLIMLKERDLSYFASEAQDERGLGDAHWMGELDQPAQRALRNGVRILDAVKDTVQSINRKLEQTIQAERETALRLEQHRERDRLQVQTKLKQTEEIVSEVERLSREFVQTHAKADGPLAGPPVASWRDQLTELASDLNLDNSAVIEQKSSKLSNDISNYLDAFAAQQHFQQHVDETQKKLTVIAAADDDAATGYTQKAQDQLREAAQALESGKLEFIDLLTQADQSMKQGEAAAAEAKERQAAAELRWRWIRSTIMFMSACFGLIVVGALTWSNRRRQATKLRAVSELSSRTESVNRETEHLDQLFQRNEDILGSREKIEQRGYVGRTRTLALQAFDYVDDLFIMSKEVKRVLAEARSLLQPTNPWHQFVNLISPSRYQQAIDHVTGKPLKFSRVTGIPLIAQQMALGDAQASTSSTNSTTDNPSPLADEVSLTFEQIFAAFQQRVVQAQSALTTFENCLSTIQDELTTAQNRLTAVSTQEQSLQDASQDGYFTVPNFFTTLIPAINQNLKQADDLAAFNAVEAVEGPLARAKQQLDEASRLSSLIQSNREKLFPQLQQTSESLRGRGYASSWIGAELESLTKRADQLFGKAATDSIAADIDELQSSLKALGDRSQHIGQLAEDLKQKHAPLLVQLRHDIDETRRDVAKMLSLKVEQVLHEIDRDPDDSLAKAQSNYDAAETMLTQGRDTAVEGAIATLLTETNQAAQILVATKNSLKEFSQTHSTLTGSLRSAEQKMANLRADTNAAMQTYATAAMKIGAAMTSSSGNQPVELTAPKSGRSIDWLLSQADQGIDSVNRLLVSSQRQYKAGELLAAAAALAQTDSLTQVIHNQQEQVQSHLDALDSQVRENQSAQTRNESDLHSLEVAGRDRLVTQATLLSIESLGERIASDAHLVAAGQSMHNPFEAARSLADSRTALEQLQSQIIGDRQAYAEARRALDGAAQQLQTASGLVRRSQTDGIPDSPEITQANARVSQLSQTLAQLQRELEVAHGDWKALDARAARLQTDLSVSARTLDSELSSATQAMATFQQASQIVLSAGQWTGLWGIRVNGSPGVSELERARRDLQRGNYDTVLQLSQVAISTAQAAIQQAEREVARRKMEEERAREAARRARNASTSIGGGIGSIGGINLGGGFGGGSSFGGGSTHSSHSSSDSSSSPASSGPDETGFGHSTW